MFKRLLSFLFAMLLLGGFSFAASCMDVSFDDADVCIDINHEGGDNYQLETDIDPDGSTSIAITCHILLPDGDDRNVSEDNCQGEFEYDSDDTEKVKLYIVVNGEYQTIEEYYDFDDGEWDESAGGDGEIDDFELDASPSNPDVDEWIDITITAVDNDGDTVTDYDGKVRFKVEERDGNSWENPSSSDYDLEETSYTFRSSDDGEKKMNDLLRLNNDDNEFRLKVYDDDDGSVYEYIVFNIDGGSTPDDGELDRFEFDPEDDTPDQDEWVEVVIEAQDSDDDKISDYDETVTLIFEIKDGSSRREADDNDLKIQSDDFNDDENDLDSNGELDVDFDNGELTFEVWFEDEEEYRITVEDGDVDEDQTFDVGGTSTSNGDLDQFEFDVEDDTPDQDEWVEVVIEAQDSDDDKISDYDETVTLTFEYKDGSSRKEVDDNDIKIQSDDFNDDENDLDSNGELEVDFDNGKLTFEVWFENEDEYRITVDDGDVDEDQTFDVGGTSSSNGDIDRFEFDPEDDTPSKDEWVEVIIEAQDSDDDRITDYDETVTLTFEYKDGSSRKEVDDTDIKIESNDFNEDENDLDSNGEIEVDFDNGTLTFDVWFENEDEYRITVDDGDVDEDQTFDVGGTSSSSNGDLDQFEFDVEDDTPDQDEWVEVVIEAQDNDGDRISDYDETVTLTFEYKNGSSRYEIDDTDIKIQSDDFNDDENDLDSNGELDVDFDNGKLTFEVWFESEDEFRITVEDGSVDEDQKFDVGGYGYGSDGDIYDFELDASDESPDEDDWIDLEIRAVDRDGDIVEDYSNKVRFSVERKSGSSWIAASSSYYDLDTTYYSFRSSDDGEAEVRDLIRFTKEADFRLKVYDSEDTTIYEYISFDVGGNGDDADTDEFDGFELDIDPSSPDESEWFDVTIEAIDNGNDRYRDYEGTIKFLLQKKSGSYRSTASSINYSIDEETITFNSADDGKVDLEDQFKIKEVGKYRLKVYDQDNVTRYGYVEFTVGDYDGDDDDDSSVDGFTQKEYDQIKAVYRIWPSIINQLEDDYRKLKYDTERQDESDDLYENMKDIVDDTSNRAYDNYDDFFDAFLDRYTLTIETR